MIVSRQALDQVLDLLSVPGEYGVDTETTGLMEHDRLFGMSIATAEESYYFNFNTCEAGSSPFEYFLDRNYVFAELQKRFFSRKENTFFIQNFKFDARMLAHEGVSIAGTAHCTYAIERVLKNNHFGAEAYSLAGCAKRRGMEKDGSVDAYISKHKLYTVVTVPGKKKKIKLPHFEQVPFEIMAKYAAHDAFLHRAIGIDQLKELQRIDLERPDGFPSILPVVENEKRLTKTCFRMERKGIQIDRARTATALEYEINQINLAEKAWLEATGEVFIDANKSLQKVFDKLGEKYPTTEKGNPSFAADVLEDMDTPVAGLVNRIRHHDKRAGTYYSSFLHFGKSGFIHADARQAGTETGRMSYRDPNLQNVPKEDDPEDQSTLYHVRECFIPRAGKAFYSLDYKQMEYCMMVDYAGELDIIKLILEGMDFHEATAKLCNITRKHAKTLNFALGYGAGPPKVAKMLGVPIYEARELINTYFGRMPKLLQLFKKVRGSGEARGYIFNWLGRRCHISHRDFSYILPNHLIQGGCGDVVKLAMNAIDDFIASTPVDLLLQVHDELLFESEPEIMNDKIGHIQHIMENIYKPQNGMILRTSVEHSFKSWGFRDKTKGLP